LKRKILVLLLVVVLIAVVAYLYTRPTIPALSIDSVYNVTKAGDAILVNVTLSDVPDCGGWETGIAWDPYVANIAVGGPNSTQAGSGGPPVDIIEGPFFQSQAPTFLMLNSVDNEKGEAIVGVVFQTPGEAVSGTGVVLMMNFTIVHPGTTTIEFRPPFPNTNQSMVVGPSEQTEIGHIEVSGLITDQGPTANWTSAGFQEITIATEVIVLAAATSVVYLRTHPRPPKSAKRKAELQPLIEPEDQR
jgi:hypothetical protein